MGEKLYYITDTYGSCYALNTMNKLVYSKSTYRVICRCVIVGRGD